MPRWRIDTDGVWVVVLWRPGLICVSRDSPCGRVRIDVDGFVGVRDGIRTRVWVCGCVRVVGVCRCGLIWVKRDSRWVRVRIDVEGFVGVTDGIRMRVCVCDCVRVVGICRWGLICVKRDSRCVRVCVEGEGFVGVTAGVWTRVCVRVCVRVLMGVCVRGANTRARVVELLPACGPIRVPILRERDRPGEVDREILGDLVILRVEL